MSTTRTERGGGSATLRLLVITPLVLLLVGLVVDTGRQTQIQAQAQQIASESARAGSNATATSRLAGGPVDTRAAVAAAAGYYTSQGVTGEVSVDPVTGQLRVTTTITTPTVFLSIVGINQVTGHGSATVSLTAGEHP